MTRRSESSPPLWGMWEVLVPAGPAGDTQEATRRATWDGAVRAISGGLTHLPDVEGQWVSPSGALVTGVMSPVRVLCTAAQAERIADMTASLYAQEAVLYYLVSDKVFVKHYERGRPT